MEKDNPPIQQKPDEDHVQVCDPQLVECITQKISEERLYSGPIPPPEHLDHYEKVLPGAADRILSLAEGEANHRRKLEKQALDIDTVIAHREKNQIAGGQWFAFIITLCFIGSGSFLIYTGKSIPGTILSMMGLVGIVSAFLKKDTPREENAENPENTEEFEE